MDAIRSLSRDMDEDHYETFLEQLKFEIEQEIELCFWHIDDPSEEHL